MIGEQYSILISTAISAGLIITIYPALLQSIIFISLIVWIMTIKIIRWSERNKIDGYLKSFLASLCAIFGIVYLNNEGIWWLALGFLYLVLSVNIMRTVFQNVSSHDGSVSRWLD